MSPKSPTRSVVQIPLPWPASSPTVLRNVEPVAPPPTPTDRVRIGRERAIGVNVQSVVIDARYADRVPRIDKRVIAGAIVVADSCRTRWLKNGPASLPESKYIDHPQAVAAEQSRRCGARDTRRIQWNRPRDCRRCCGPPAIIGDVDVVLNRALEGVGNRLIDRFDPRRWQLDRHESRVGSNARPADAIVPSCPDQAGDGRSVKSNRVEKIRAGVGSCR